MFNLNRIKLIEEQLGRISKRLAKVEKPFKFKVADEVKYNRPIPKKVGNDWEYIERIEFGVIVEAIDQYSCHSYGGDRYNSYLIYNAELKATFNVEEYNIIEILK